MACKDCGAHPGTPHDARCNTWLAFLLGQKMESLLAPKPDTEALFKKFVDEFPVLSALDVFCSPCARPRAISYHKGDPLGVVDDHYFYVLFSCNCRNTIAISCHSDSRPLTRARVAGILRSE